MLAQQGNLRRAVEHARNSHKLLGDNDNPALEAKALGMVGSLAGMLGDHEEGRTALERALVLHQCLGDHYGESGTLRWLADIARQTGRPTHALELYQRSATLSRAANNAFNEADALRSLGEMHLQLGNKAQARADWQRAVELFENQHRTADARQLRQRIDATAP